MVGTQQIMSRIQGAVLCNRDASSLTPSCLFRLFNGTEKEKGRH